MGRTIHWDFQNDLGRICGTSELRDDEDPDDTLARMNARFGNRSHWLDGPAPLLTQAKPSDVKDKRSPEYIQGYKDGRRHTART